MVVAGFVTIARVVFALVGVWFVYLLVLASALVALYGLLFVCGLWIFDDGDELIALVAGVYIW